MTVPAFTADNPYGPSIYALIEAQAPGFGDVNLTVNPSDDMFNYAVQTIGDRELAIMSYFRCGLSMHDTATRIARWWWGDLDRVSSWLDFAAGYGRSTRFLARELGPSRVWIGEIQEDAVDFQSLSFGVHGIVSTTDPEAFKCDQRFDVIFVASLFSHLPESTFGRWLRALFELLTDEGVLIFSTHAASLAGQDMVVPPEGLLFLEQSEIEDLDTSDYGVTFVSEEYVRKCVDAYIEAGFLARFPQALAFHQDVYVVGRATTDRTPVLAAEPGGNLDVVRVGDDGISLQGWAVDVESDTCEVIATLGRRVLGRAWTGTQRSDVAEHFHRAERAFEYSGWRIDAEVAEQQLRADEPLVVTVLSSGGRRFVLDAAPLTHAVRRTGGTVHIAPSGRFRPRQRARTAVDLYRRGGIGAIGEYLRSKF